MIRNGNFTIKPYENESAEGILRRFTRKTKKSRLLNEVFERSFFEKESVKERKRHLRAIKEERKRLLEERDLENFGR
jgi:ribosomal protein S21